MRLLNALRSRHASQRANDDGMISIVMIVIIIGMGLAAVLTPLVVTQSRSTSHSDSRVQALHQAEAGINAMLGRVRNARSAGTVSGQASLLPCFDPASAGPLTLPQSGPSMTGYAVTLQYFTADPFKFPTSLTTCALVANGAVPSFAKITSTGKAGTGSQYFERTLITNYSFETADIYGPAATTASGGQIRFNPAGPISQPQCVDAGLSPVVGSTLLLQPCSAPATPAQLFHYNSDLSLQLVSSVSGTAPYGLCIDSVSPTTAVSLQPCLSTGNAAYDTQWSLDGNAAFGQTRPDSSHVCLTVPLGMTSIQAQACVAGYNATAAWQPTPSIGTGAAGAAASQLVNLSQFGRCIQVTNQIVPTGSANPFTILYPCEQTTSPSLVDWYQAFAWDPATSHWVTTKPGDAQKYCLTSQGADGAYVTVLACSAVNPLQKWTDNGAASVDQAAAQQLGYDIRYTIVDNNGRCLSLSPTAGATADWFAPAGTSNQYSKITTNTCDVGGSARQKWNADPDPDPSTLKNTSEK